MAIKKSLKQFIGLLLFGQVFLIGAILQTDTVTYSDIQNFPKSSELYEMTIPKPIVRDIVSFRTNKKPKPMKQASVIGVSFKTNKPFNLVELELSQKVKIYRKNQGGKLLRIRVEPTLSPLSKTVQKQLKDRFITFSIHRTDKYAELVFAASGRIGNPYTSESSTKKQFYLSIPYRTDASDFLVPSGKKVEDGLTYYRDRVPIGNRKTDVHILRMEPFTNTIKTFPVLANEGICQKERLSSMAKRYNAVAAINGAYFTSKGDPIGTLIINRSLISSPLYKRSVFGITDDEGIVFGNPDFKGFLRTEHMSLKIDGVNQPRRGNQLVVYTPEFSETTLTTQPGLELVLVKGKVVGIHRKDTFIPPDGVIISAGAEKAVELAGIKLGESVKLDYSIDKPWNTIKHAVCGGPRLISNGRRDINGKQEKFSNSIVYGRHPRTAVAITFDGDLLYVVVDGRTKRNSGMKLKELAGYLQRLGARQAINLDGGGSSSMIVNGKTVNRPSGGGERRISNGILITKR